MRGFEPRPQPINSTYSSGKPLGHTQMGFSNYLFTNILHVYMFDKSSRQIIGNSTAIHESLSNNCIILLGVVIIFVKSELNKVRLRMGHPNPLTSQENKKEMSLFWCSYWQFFAYQLPQLKANFYWPGTRSTHQPNIYL